MTAGASSAAGPAERLLGALNEGEGLVDEFIYHLPWNDYTAFPDPFPRTVFTTTEVTERIFRYPDPAQQGELFPWDIHGRLLMPAHEAIPGVAVVMIHGGAANECEFLFTPDGPEEFLALTQVDPHDARVAQHVGSLGIPALAVSLPGHYSASPWPPIATRRPEFVPGEAPSDAELENRLAVYTFRMCLEAIKALIEKTLPGYGLLIWGHSTGGEYFYLMEQYGLQNRLIGGLGFGTGMPAGVVEEWESEYLPGHGEGGKGNPPAVVGVARRSPKGYEQSGYTGPNQPWGSAENWFRLEEHRRPMFKPFLQSIEHHKNNLQDAVKKTTGLPDEELFITFGADLHRLEGKKMLYFIGERDKSHWMEAGDVGVHARREVFALRTFSEYAEKVRLVVIPRLTHYGHIEAHNERLANLMVTGMKHCFPR